MERQRLTVRCWKSHARMMLVATLGKMPRFFCRFLSLSGSSSSPVPGEATLLSKPSPKERESFLEKWYIILHTVTYKLTWNPKIQRRQEEQQHQKNVSKSYNTINTHAQYCGPSPSCTSFAYPAHDWHSFADVRVWGQVGSLHNLLPRLTFFLLCH